jgi:hypothetical protein
MHTMVMVRGWSMCILVLCLMGLFAPNLHGEFLTPRPDGVKFPILLSSYEKCESQLAKELGRSLTLWETICVRASIAPMNVVVTLLFACAIIHTFMAPRFLRLSHRIKERHERRLSTHASKWSGENAPVSFGATICHF